jgi:SAM-dependent methyltransferase
MNWRITQAESRQRYLTKYDTSEVEAYEHWIRQLTNEDDDACLRDIQSVFSFKSAMTVLDAGSGSGAMSKTLLRVPGLTIHAIEPSPAMIAMFRTKEELNGVNVKEGFCDAIEDRSHFQQGTFDVVVSRQLVNGLFDPLVAFQNWHHWLKPGGTVIALDGLFDRTGWTGRWQEEVDVLPMSSCRSTATIPYLLENSGFDVISVQLMTLTNARPTVKTQRYCVVATKN